MKTSVSGRAILKHGGAFIGYCGLRSHHGRLGVAEFGVHIIPEHWRKGYALEAGCAVTDYAFNTLYLNAFFAGYNPENLASRGLLQRLGFVYNHDEFYAPTGLEHPSYELTNASHGFAPDEVSR